MIASLLAPTLAAILSVSYIIGWCLLSDLSFTQIRLVFGRTRRWLSLLILLDAGRAAAVATVALLAVINRGGTISPSVAKSVIFWLGVGVSSFFVGFRLPPSTDLTMMPKRARVPSETRGRGSRVDSTIGPLLYNPNIGIIAGLRRKCVSRLEDAVAAERSQHVALAVAAVQQGVARWFPTGASEQDVQRIIVECREYLEAKPQSLEDPARKELLDYFERLELDMNTMGRRRPAAHRETVHAILHKLSKFKLYALQQQVLDTTKLSRGSEGG